MKKMGMGRKSMPQGSHEHDMQRQHEGHPHPMHGSGKAMPHHESLPGGRKDSMKGPKSSPQL